MRKKQLVSLLLVGAMTLSLCACGESGDDSSDSVISSGTETAAGTESQEESVDSQIYDEVLGEFYSTYQAAEDAESVSERYALMAVAEAKLLESGVVLPTTTRGGYYAVSKMAPYTSDWTLWGNDYERYHSALVTTETIKATDRAEMKEKWAELKGTGEYYEWAKSYLEDKGYTIKDTYNMIYDTDPVTWDALATSLAADSEAIINTYDGLMEYDCEGELQPALAESYEVSDDGLTYTFHLRDDAVWTDSQGRELASVTADDFVAGMQHMMDAQGGLEYLIEGVIENAQEYIEGTVTDFSQVGVEATDEHTVVYTLAAPCSYFVTMLGYGVFAPMNRDYYESCGGKFGAEYDNSAADYTYGTDSDHIAYCGPYLVTNSTSKNTIVFEASDSYYAPEKVAVKKLVWFYNDGSDPTKAYSDFKAGTLDGATLNNSVLQLAKDDGIFDDYAYISNTDATSYMAFMNVNRQAYANTNDDTKAVSSMTDDQKERTDAAMLNVHFRRALCFSVDRATYNAQSTGEEIKLNSLRNSYTPGNFVSLSEDVTIDINGTSTTFAAGTNYGEICQAQIDADGVKITVWDPTADDGVGSSDGFDGWYNADNAVEELDQAISELSEDGVDIDESNPIYVDLPYESDSELYQNRAQAFKKSVEASLGGKVIVNLVDCATVDEWLYAGYYTSYGYESNYSIYDLSGWGPDYGDPATYLNTMLPDYAGYMCRCLGMF